MYKIILLIIISFFINGCSTIGAMIAMNKSTDSLIPLSTDKRVLYENGAEELAKEVSSKLDKAISIIEEKQYSKFKDKVVVHVLNSPDSFSSYCVSKRPRACVLNERLFISPKAKDTINGILVHELSHLQMEQDLGMLHWHFEIPSWFQEGLAVFVSKGGGAEKISHDKVVKAIKNEQSFKPNEKGSLFFPKTASYFNLKGQMYYAQSELFVKYLYSLNEDKFKSLILQIRNGNTFSSSINISYEKTVSELWEEFIEQIKANNTRGLNTHLLPDAVASKN